MLFIFVVHVCNYQFKISIIIKEVLLYFSGYFDELIKQSLSAMSFAKVGKNTLRLILFIPNIHTYPHSHKHNSRPKKGKSSVLWRSLD